MAEIKVIESVVEEKDINKLSPQERNFLFEKIGESIPGIPRKYFEDFDANQSTIIRLENLRIKPDLRELLVRKIVELSAYVYQQQMHFLKLPTVAHTRPFIVVPIVDEITAADVFQKKAQKYRSTSIAKPNVSKKSKSTTGGKLYGVIEDTNKPENSAEYTGSAAFAARRMLSRKQMPLFSKPKSRIEIAAQKSVRVRFDTPILCFTINNIMYIAPSNEEIDVLGLMITPLCDNKLPTKIAGRIPIGSYLVQSVANDCSQTIESPNSSLPNDIESNLDANNVAIFETLDDSKIRTILDSAFKYLIGLINWANSTSAAHSLYTQLQFARDKKIGDLKSDKNLAGIFLNQTNRPDHRETEWPKISAEKEKIAKIISDTIGHGFGNETQLMLDLNILGLLDFLYLGIIKGKDSKEFKEDLEIIKTRILRQQLEKKIRETLVENTYRAGLLKMLMEKKFSTKRYAEILNQLKLRPQLSGNEILKVLTDKEQKIINAELELRERQYNAMLMNKCPHVAIYRRFRRAKSDEQVRKHYEELKKYIGSETSESATNKRADYTDFIKCNNCGFDLICPHYNEMTIARLNKRSFNEIKTKITKYIDEKPVQGSYYCKICSEMIATVEMYGNVMSDADSRLYSSISDELKTMMWSEIAGIMRFVSFGTLVNVPKLITAVISEIYEYIFEIEKQLLKSKTNTAEDVKNKKRLFITIYAYAYIINLVANNKASDIAFKGMKGRTSIADYVKFAIVNIIQTKNVIINQIANISNDFIKTKLIDAYKLIAMKGPQTIHFSDQAEDLFNVIVLDPLFYYLYYINSIDNPARIKKSLYDPIDNMEYLLGGTIAQVEKFNDVYEKARIPGFNAEKWNLKAIDSIKPPANGEIMGAGARRAANKGNIARSFELFWEKLRGKLYNEFLYVEGEINKKFADYWANAQKLIKKEADLALHRDLANFRGVGSIPFKESRQYKPQEISIGRLFDEDGNAHKFDIYVYKDGEIKRGDIPKLLADGKRFTQKVVDRRCSVCGALVSEVDSLSPEKIKESLNVKNRIGNFFQFYEHRCPEGDVHDFEGDTCKKCGLTRKMILNTDSKESRTYYRKYAKKYAKDREELKEEEDISYIEAEKTAIDKLDKEIKSFEKSLGSYVFNFNKILELSTKIKTNSNAIMALGATEGVEYSEILSGKYVPTISTFRDDTRIYVIYSYIQMVVTEYNNLRFYNMLLKPPAKLTELLENSDVKKHEYSKLEENMPSVIGDFNKKFIYFKRNKKPRELVEFCLESFAQICLDIFQAKDEGDIRTSKLRRDFVTYIVKKILKLDELNSKPGQVNWNIFRNELAKQVEDVLEGDVKADRNYDEDTGLETYEDMKETKEEDEDGDFGDTNKVMANKFDIDLEEGQDIEDFENEAVKLEDSDYVTGLD